MFKVNRQRIKKGVLSILGGAFALIFLYSGSDRPSQLEQVLQRGSLTMLTRNGASSYYLGPDGPTGPEYMLVREFADFLGVDLEVEVAVAFNRLADLLATGRGDLIAANLARTPRRDRIFSFGPAYMETATVVVYRRGQPRPLTLEDLVGQKIMVLAGSSYEEALETAARDLPGLKWESRSDVGMESLLLAVSDGAIDITLTDATIFQLNGRYYPRAAIAFTLPGSLPLAWAFRPGPDDSLLRESYAFMQEARSKNLLQALREAFFSAEDRLDRVGMHQFMRQVRDRLPAFLPVFQEVANVHGMDWRLLAAIGYQESHWRADASSYTGVRGLMMLTQRTARQLGVTDRLDPAQSIEGGARYFLRLHDRIPARIAEPDRTWLALAAYNMGMGHLEDARVLTEKQGGDPDSWDEVKLRLDLLSQEEWYRQTRYGFARGSEAKKYVENIRNYYEILKWMDTQDHPLLALGAAYTAELAPQPLN